jgi:hypothetical protein
MKTPSLFRYMCIAAGWEDELSHHTCMDQFSAKPGNRTAFVLRLRVTEVLKVPSTNTTSVDPEHTSHITHTANVTGFFTTHFERRPRRNLRETTSSNNELSMRPVTLPTNPINGGCCSVPGLAACAVVFFTVLHGRQLLWFFYS